MIPSPYILRMIVVYKTSIMVMSRFSDLCLKLLLYFSFIPCS